MIEKISNEFIFDSNNFIFLLSPKWIKRRGWYCRIYMEYYDLIESSFISNAIKEIDQNAIEFYFKSYDLNYQNNNSIFIKDVKRINQEFIYNFPTYDLEISINYAGLTNKNLDYIFFKDAENDLFMLFGNENFIKKAMPISYEEYKVYFHSFFGNWASEKIDNLLKKLWTYYPIC
jgi:hypothetical protein